MNLDEVREDKKTSIEQYQVYCEMIVNVGDKEIRQIHTI